MAKGKGQRRIWAATLAVNTTIGEHDYDIEPQAVARFQSFSEIIERLFKGWGGEAGPRSEPPTGSGADSADVIAWVLDIPHPVLQVFIPDLTEADALSCSVPQLKWLFETIWEVNGFDWFKDVLKNVPLLPSAQQAIAAAGQGSNSRPANVPEPTNQPTGDGVT